MDLNKSDFPTVAEAVKPKNEELNSVVIELENALDYLENLDIILEDILNDTEDNLSNSGLDLLVKNRILRRGNMGCDYHDRASKALRAALETVMTIRSRKNLTTIGGE